MERQSAKHTPHDRDALDQATEAAIRTQRQRERAVLGVWVGSTVVALLATVMFLESCGNSGRSANRQTSQVQSEPAASQVVVASTLPVEAGSGAGAVSDLSQRAEPDGL